MPAIPTNYAEALQHDVEATLQYIADHIDVVAAQAKIESLKKHLLFAEQQNYSEEYQAKASESLENAFYELDCAEWSVQRSRTIRSWESGYFYDFQGLDYFYTVDYSPCEYGFVVTLCDEADTGEIAFLKTKEAAIEYVSKRESLVNDGEEPEPILTTEESNAAGEIVIIENDTAVKIKDLVEKILDQANKGCGQHYEIFASRAQTSLSILAQKFTGEDATNIKKYLDHCRY